MSLGHILARFASVGMLLVSTGALADTVTLRRVAVDLPGSDREFPPGPGAELVTNNCTACHSAGMILTQPTLTKATWLGEVKKMQSTYKAPVADEDVEPIVSYLASLPIAK